MTPLGLLGRGESGEVIGIRNSGGHGCGHSHECGHQACACRMADMGIRPGRQVEILKNEGGGPLVVKVDESRIAMDRGMAMKILIRRKGE